MARVTVEDCVERVPNRFDLVMLASQRARDISSGAPETLPRDNDKNPVVALREIAAKSVEYDALQDSLIQSLQKVQPSDDLEEDDEVVTALQADSSVLGVGHPGAASGQQPSVASAAAQPQGQTEGEDAAAAGDAGDSGGAETPAATPAATPADAAADDDPDAAA